MLANPEQAAQMTESILRTCARWQLSPWRLLLNPLGRKAKEDAAPVTGKAYAREVIARGFTLCHFAAEDTNPSWSNRGAKYRLGHSLCKRHHAAESASGITLRSVISEVRGPLPLCEECCVAFLAAERLYLK